MRLFLIGCLYSGLQVAQIVQAVENTDDINTVGNGLLYEIFYYIVCIMIVSQDILSTEQHLQLGLLESVT